ncbi:hypothetical protein D187_002322 [Cystobacter fuscus DSM 2262]|uniref:Uncharacterized protein n=1 Tax=Cystobacter fuscus (strain ATCC 25194 / DSM 2262 / NBRC 100088 / M29) TaxID=1242864 RepID=S9PAV4_CYSF2|nr:hypothetical protein [Cystobacter fuscus]EPX60236.1 hypothetical protein D187_002322 [Cystobacter fuscus DSM 2262]
MGAVPDPERTHSAPVIISAILLLVETKLHQLGCMLRGEENPAHLLTPHNVTAGQYAVGCTRDACLPAAGEAYKVRESH